MARYFIYTRAQDTTITYSIGDKALGGVIAYILVDGDPGYDAAVQHGLVAYTGDTSAGAAWGCYGTSISGADGTALGTGNQNTIDIMAGCATAGIAARLCGDLDIGGYQDWFLPSKNELNKLYLNKTAIGGFAANRYWSSSELNSIRAWFQHLSIGYQSYTYKSTSTNQRVRAIRAF